MKSDTERKKFYTEALHKRKNRLHVHLSKDLRSKLKAKKRSVQVRTNDKVKVMRGKFSGKEAKVVKVSVFKRKVYLEGLTQKNVRGKESLIPLDPSNLLLIGLDETKERKQIFSDEVFKKEKDVPKPAKADVASIDAKS